jgi:hypothetical protein
MIGSLFIYEDWQLDTPERWIGGDAEAVWRSDIVTWRQKSGVVKSEETPIARLRLGKHIPAETGMQATIE